MSFTAQEVERDWQGVDLSDERAVIGHGIARYHPRIAIASSFSHEDVMLIHLAAETRADVRVFALDTGRLPEETYACAEAVRRQYGVRTQWFFPRYDEVELLEHEKGLFSFRESIANRLECCRLRKVEPLSRALLGLDAWITGLRREQGVTRRAVRAVELDDVHGGIVKLNPLAGWTFERVQAFVREHRLPHNRLYDQGYASIGCAPCTRPVRPGEDPRAGRWWWEDPEHKECGLHPGSAAPNRETR
jgi:phosphoadenosine phosphosulfate reductase